jgi:hypothetical protein
MLASAGLKRRSNTAAREEAATIIDAIRPSVTENIDILIDVHADLGDTLGGETEHAAAPFVRARYQQWKQAKDRIEIVKRILTVAGPRVVVHVS